MSHSTRHSDLDQIKSLQEKSRANLKKLRQITDLSYLSPRYGSFLAGNNTVGSAKLSDSTLKLQLAEHKRQIQSPKVVVSIPSTDIKTWAKDAAKLVEKTVGTRSANIFNYTLYLGNDGKRVTVYAEYGDLYSAKYNIVFHHLNNLTLAQQKELIAQLILIVSRFHVREITHGDIKPINIFIFLDAHGNMRLVLGDPDSIQKADQLDTKVATESYIAPEALLGSSPLNLKAVDCYALGCTINHIVSDFYFQKTHDLNDLIEKLTAFSPIERLSDMAAKDHPYFGNTPAERRDYFNNLENKFAREDLVLDGYRVPTYPFVGDAFHILPRKIKRLYRDMDSLAAADFKSADLTKVQSDIRTIHEESFHYGREYTGELSSRIKEVHLDSRGMLYAAEYKRLHTLTAHELIGTVKAAVDEYKRVNNLDKSLPWYSFLSHGAKGRQRAINLYNSIKDLRSPPNIFSMIYQLLSGSEGRWGKTSFNTILAKKLGEICQLPFEDWYEYYIPEREVYGAMDIKHEAR